ncbi:MAG: sulfite exporter TauE/SafE family protein [Candidatus Aminicenantes bacterium]|nr:sulfite exporter TauE/SafE family protein [Candidatus Aminicenantes bacterium]
MIVGILGALVVLVLSFAVYFFKDLSANKGSLEKDTNFAAASGIGFITNFLDTLGIGSFAPMTALLRGFKQIRDRVIPGTLNVSCTIPVAVEAFIFITVIKVEILTLIFMVIAAVAGAVVGAGIVAKLSEKKIQMIMGIALLTTAFFMLSGRLGWIAGLGTGEAIGLTGWKLIIAVIVNFLLGALQSAGIGMYAPSMALVYILGMSPRVAFPIMMTSAAFTLAPASIKFINEDAYNRKASLAITLSGIVGVFIAAYIVKSLPLEILTWLVIVVIVYTAIVLLLKATSKEKIIGSFSE